MLAVISIKNESSSDLFHSSKTYRYSKDTEGVLEFVVRLEKTYLSNLVDAHAKTVQHDLVGLADELHITVLNSVVNHLDEMAGTVLADPIAAGLSVDFG